MRSTPLAVLSIFIFLLLDKIAPYVITILVILPVAIEGITTAISNIDKNLLDDAKLNSPSIFKTIIYFLLLIIMKHLYLTIIYIIILSMAYFIISRYPIYQTAAAAAF